MEPVAGRLPVLEPAGGGVEKLPDEGIAAVPPGQYHQLGAVQRQPGVAAGVPGVDKSSKMELVCIDGSMVASAVLCPAHLTVQL